MHAGWAGVDHGRRAAALAAGSEFIDGTGGFDGDVGGTGAAPGVQRPAELRRLRPGAGDREGAVVRLVGRDRRVLPYWRCNLVAQRQSMSMVEASNSVG